MIATELQTDFLKRAEVATRLGVSVGRVGQLTQRGDLAFIETPLGRLYPVGDVERLAKEREARSVDRQS